MNEYHSHGSNSASAKSSTRASEAEPGGSHLENIIAHDLIAWRDTLLEPPTVMYWRTTMGEEVDFVVEAPSHLLPIEVKATSRIRPDDARHLHTFRAEYPERALPGILIYAGDETILADR